MVDAFNGPIFLVLFIINFWGGAYYAYQALFTSEKFCDQYGIHHSAILPLRLAGSLIAALVLVSIYILFRENGPQGAWSIFVFGFKIVLVSVKYYMAWAFSSRVIFMTVIAIFLLLWMRHAPSTTTIWMTTWDLYGGTQ